MVQLDVHGLSAVGSLQQALHRQRSHIFGLKLLKPVFWNLKDEGP
jgi:hypothetical protein